MANNLNEDAYKEGWGQAGACDKIYQNKSSSIRSSGALLKTNSCIVV